MKPFWKGLSWVFERPVVCMHNPLLLIRQTCKGAIHASIEAGRPKRPA
jgi:hypothetical protein